MKHCSFYFFEAVSCKNRYFSACLLPLFIFFFFGLGISSANQGLKTEAEMMDKPPPKTFLPVRIEQNGQAFVLYRGGEPYFIKGIGGNRHFEEAVSAGANSVRTWSAHNIGSFLDKAYNSGLTVMIGIWLSHSRKDYSDPEYRDSKKKKIRELLDSYREHPALLMWSLGNEINLNAANDPEIWQFVNELAGIIKENDPHHPVITVIVYSAGAMEAISRHAPNLDAIGINAYGILPDLRSLIEKADYHGPYIVTEWGADGHWEADRTDWGRQIEPTSSQKADIYLKRYRENILANRDRCLGSYVFLWGQKQECTPTWYGMFIEDDAGKDSKLSCPQVDAMRLAWSGQQAENLSPVINGITLDGLAAAENAKFSPCSWVTAAVEAFDPEDDELSYTWELMEETDFTGLGGSFEARPRTVCRTEGRIPQLCLYAPEKEGDYRLYVYVSDGKGHAGTANFPFKVE